jgi:uncharacterized lipoprotein YajG
MFRIVLIICLSSLFLTSCATQNPEKWPLPQKPELSPVYFQRVANGFYLSENNATNLVNNIDNLKAYIKKLEILIKTIGG